MVKSIVEENDKEVDMKSRKEIIEWLAANWPDTLAGPSREWIPFVNKLADEWAEDIADAYLRGTSESPRP